MICASSPILVFTSYGGWSKATPTFLEAPANPLERSSRQTLLSLPPPQHPPPRHLTPIPRGSAPGAAPLHIAEVLDEPSSPTGPAQALLTVTQNKGITPGKKQMLCSTCASPARGPVATSITPGSHLSVDLPLLCPHLLCTAFSKKDYRHSRSLGKAIAHNTHFHRWTAQPSALGLGCSFCPGGFYHSLSCIL